MTREALIVPEDFPPTYRGADEDWAGVSAFGFKRYAVAPVTNADGTVTPGQPRDLSDCSARGLLYRRDLFFRFPLGAAIQAPVPLSGVILDPPTAGEFDLELVKALVLTLEPQDRHDVLTRYILRALLTDPAGRESWVGTVPVFVL